MVLWALISIAKIILMTVNITTFVFIIFGTTHQSVFKSCDSSFLPLLSISKVNDLGCNFSRFIFLGKLIPLSKYLFILPVSIC